MIRLPASILCLVAACSTGEPTTSLTAAPAPREAPQSSLVSELAWLPVAASSVLRMRPGQIAYLELFGRDQGGRSAPCWRDIEAGIEAGYQVELGAGRTFHAMRAPVDRDTVERCAESVFPPGHLLHVRAVRDGDLTRLETDELGTAVLWWRGGGWVVVGTAAQVAAAREATGSAASSPCMRQLLAMLPDKQLAAARCDVLFDNLLGVPTEGWLLGVSIERDGTADGRVTVLFPSPAEASRATRVMASRSLPTALPAPIRDFLYTLPVSADGARMLIDIHVSPADFEKVDVAALQRLTEERKGASAATP